MKTVFGLLVTLLGVCYGVETSCDGRQDGALCYGALGGTLVLHLMDDASIIFRYQWKKEETTILSGGKKRNVTNLIKNRSSFTPKNGTFTINNLIREDAGKYSLEIFNSSGLKPEPITLQLTIQAPVSSVQLVSECLPQSDMRVSCSSGGGDSTQYSWTLNGIALMKSQLLSGNNEGQIITLRPEVSGRLVCTVRNHISSVSKKVKISSCGVETYCDGRQDGALCYGALGGTLVLHLMDNASEMFEYRLRKETTEILQGRQGKIVTNPIRDRSSFTPQNGTFRINNLIRKDAGEYSLEIFDSSGLKSVSKTLQLTIQAPVSSVQLVSECLSQGEQKVSCSSGGGDGPRHSWTLDGHTLLYTQLLSGNGGSQMITLKQDLSGLLVCTVRNHISSVSEEERIVSCGYKFFDCTLLNGTYVSQWLFPTNEIQCMEQTFLTDPVLLICGLKAAVIFLMLTGIFVFLAWKKNKQMKAKIPADHNRVDYENTSVAMVEMRSSAAEP
ncbi:hemicentin-1-like [Xyrichtys novacula]|uniref:Hemicentin-1-like n=1 Tax=Xyrichtys novacula TaxID=13765 RepID=A0AAV1FB11_XYRNO|nr:hemicentin-1-like [Xyrichtys novacula]